MNDRYYDSIELVVGREACVNDQRGMMCVYVSVEDNRNDV